ncbi:Zn-ribbon domain-containing OB-fold protein [Sphingobium sp.]|uniref:Zn-ribbon domain-containing OB-fold protein n=1 Tax=Sphingobium sp. TaxID=1912891 RepID=UPI0028BD6BB9|nr:Zn-ribbon domain-containing OB-fold protein [Sphingobium sp.]
MSEVLNDTLGVERTVPRHYSFSQPYWDATREKKLVLQYCRQSGQFQFYPRPVNIFTGGRDLEWREVSGRGQVFSWTVATIARPPFAGHTPYLVVTVTLDEGVNVIANLINCPLDRVAVGLRVRPVWAPLPDGTNLLLFEPDDGEGASVNGETI